MKKIIIILLTLPCLFGLISCDEDGKLVGSGNIISEFRTVDPFEDIVIRGVVVTKVIYGQTQSIEVRADDNIIHLIKTQLSQEKLVVEFEEGDYSHVTVEVDITIPLLNSLTNNGVTTTTISDFVNMGTLTINNTGVGSLTLSGSADKLILENTGTGSLEGFEFVVDTCLITQTGVGDIKITVNELLAGTLTGVGNIFYKGSPQIDVAITGVGNLINSN